MVQVISTPGRPRLQVSRMVLAHGHVHAEYSQPLPTCEHARQSFNRCPSSYSISRVIIQKEWEIKGMTYITLKVVKNIDRQKNERRKSCVLELLLGLRRIGQQLKRRVVSRDGGDDYAPRKLLSIRHPYNGLGHVRGLLAKTALQQPQRRLQDYRVALRMANRILKRPPRGISMLPTIARQRATLREALAQPRARVVPLGLIAPQTLRGRPGPFRCPGCK